MTQEEKARAYDEALKRAKEIKSKILSSHLSTESCKVVSEYIDEIIPELRESEDERIVRCIGTALTDVDEQRFKDFGITLKDCLTYLEKQKEQKSIESVAAEVTKDKESAIKFLKSAGIMDDNGKLAEMYRSEQKPAEWNEEDEGELQNAIDALEFLGKKGVYKSASGYDAALQAASWLKSLRPQPKQEWSEEDKKKITFLERLIRYNVPEGQYGWTDGHKGVFVNKLEAISILKSLNPSWKPSKEQMDRLFSIVAALRKDYCDDMADFLASLYKQLKAL